MSHYLVQPSSGPLSGEACVPGDKSIGHRSIIFGALASGELRIRGLGAGADNRSTARAFQQLGVAIRAEGELTVVSGCGLHGLRAPDGIIDCGNSGTTIRLLAGLLAAQDFGCTLTGDQSLQRRPMKRVTLPLMSMGAQFVGASGARPGELYPPLIVQPSAQPLCGIDYQLPVASAQVKSALLLAALYAEGESRLTEPGPSRDHSERMLRYLGCPIRSEVGGVTSFDPSEWRGQLDARDLDVPGDPSAAAFPIAAALIAGADRVRVPGICINDTRTGFLDALRAMGATVEVEQHCGNGQDSGPEPVADLIVEGGPAQLRATDLGGEVIVRAIDEIPVLAVVAARAEGITWFRDAAELRVKESDRIAATCELLRAFGVEVQELPDAFAVHGLGGRPFAPGRVHAGGDHRIAMAAAVAALAATGSSRVDDVANVATSFPGFADMLRGLGAELTHGE